MCGATWITFVSDPTNLGLDLKIRSDTMLNFKRDLPNDPTPIDFQHNHTKPNKSKFYLKRSRIRS